MRRVIVSEFVSLDGVIEDPVAKGDPIEEAGPSKPTADPKGTSSSSTSWPQPTPSFWGGSPTRASPPPGRR
jgi:hypothetical protein